MEKTARWKIAVDCFVVCNGWRSKFCLPGIETLDILLKKARASTVVTWLERDHNFCMLYEPETEGATPNRQLSGTGVFYRRPSAWQLNG
jgi:hypothetical protein